MIFLVGFMGCGKTTVGRMLAQRLDSRFRDTDAMVEEALGRTIPEIFETLGEGRFRGAEWEALSSLDGERRCVVATGGGLFVGLEQRRWIRAHGRSVWLDLPLDECRGRVSDGPERPLWAGRGRLGLRAMFEKRRAVYALADIRVDASGPADVVVERLIGRAGPFFD